MKEDSKMKLAVLASGRGSNFVAIHDAILRGDIDAEIDVLITNKPSAGVIDIAKKRNVDVSVIESKGLAAGEFDRKVVDLLEGRGISLVILAGFMKIVGKAIIDAFPLRIINIHPSLLPAFKGLDAQRQALEYGVKLAGCTVHFIDEGLDSGSIILQKAVAVATDDSVDTLSEKILVEEHLIYPEAVKLFVEGRLHLEGRKVFIDGK